MITPETTDQAGAPRIVAKGLSKHFGDVRAVVDLSFTVEPGSVTGFLGPNGAGKTTTLRMILGLAHPDSGEATVAGRHYRDLQDPGRTVGAVLEANSFHPGRSARNHLRVYTAAAGLPDSRADEVLELVGLTPFARKLAGGFSTGMRQRLALATALLGNPRILVLDEPANGLDPEGIVWLRGFLRHLADNEGRTILVSSHVLSEVEQTVDRVVILRQGQLVREGTLQELRSQQSGSCIVRVPDEAALRAALASLPHVTIAKESDRSLRVSGATGAEIGHAAWSAHVEIHQLSDDQASLEGVFLALTGGTTE
jgi:ABC-2 type transport system ATP-binding protein